MRFLAPTASWAAVCFLAVSSPPVLAAQEAQGYAGGSAAHEQAAAAAAVGTVVPRLIKFSGELNPPLAQTAPNEGHAGGKNASPAVLTATFCLYELQEGGSALWSETQKVRVDDQGRYSVLLGATQPEGLPLDLFTSGQALWLGVQPQGPGTVEEPRVLLVAVPYALKAADADTLGGLPASAYALAASGLNAADGALSPAAAPPGTTPSRESRAPGPEARLQPAAACAAVTSDGTATANDVAKFTAACNIEKSLLFDNGTDVGIGTTTPGAFLDTQGTSTATSGNVFGARTIATWNPAASSSANVLAVFSNAATATGNSRNYTGNLTAFQFEADHNGTGTLTKAYGGYGAVRNLSTGTISNAYSLYSYLHNFSTGTVTNAFGLYVADPTNAGGGTVSNYYGVYISNPTTAATGYGLYSLANTNYMSGSLGIGTTTPGAALEVSGTTKFDKAVTFANTQMFPGTLTGVTAGGGLVAAGSTVGLLKTCRSGQGLAWNGSAWSCANAVAGGPFATLGANTFTATQAISSGDLSIGSGDLDLPATTSAGTGVINLGGVSFIHDCCPKSTQNTFVGNGAGNFNQDATSTDSGIGYNTGVGLNALTSNTNGYQNTATGAGALSSNTTGDWNTAVGYNALPGPGDGVVNTAVGYESGQNLGSTSGGDTFIGASSGPGTSNAIFNATAIGYAATVSQSNAVILGGTGINGVTVGIGTATPFNDYALDVEARGQGTFSNVINSGVVVNAAGGNLYLGLTNDTHMFRVDTTGVVHAANFVTSGVDFAESVAVRGSTSLYEPGDLLVIDPGGKRRLALSRKPYSTLVAGIYSTKPGMLATPHPVDAKFEGEVPLAVVGIVPCKVTAENGAIRVGDLLVTSSRAGYAMKGTDRRRLVGAVVGKALEPLPKETGVIEVLVTLQ